MYGINAGYDTRPMAKGYADTGVNVNNSNTVYFQQAAVNLEAVSSVKTCNAYVLLPTGTKNYRINSVYQAGALNTYGFDVGYHITPELTTSVGYYYQQGDLTVVNGSGVKARLVVDVTENMEFAGTYTYDDSFDSRASADLKIRFGGTSYEQKSGMRMGAERLQVQSLSSMAGNRSVRVHDFLIGMSMLQLE